MKRLNYIYLLAFSCLFSLASCHHRSAKITRAFYYWQSTFNLTSADTAFLQRIKIAKFYVHFFDVRWNSALRQALPIAKIKFVAPPPNIFTYVPVIYITDKTLKNTGPDSIIPLTKHILKETKYIALTNKIKFDELQIDCDWTVSTRQKYFALLTYLHTALKQQKKILSATIRLHQVKYYNITGIPPIDRGMLMFYNMGTLNAVVGYNSIYNAHDADKYASYISSYPLPLDLALPIYSWGVCIRNGRVNNLIQRTNRNDFTDTAFFHFAGNDIFVARHSFFLHGIYFMKNDSLKLESINPALCEDAAKNASCYLKPACRTVSLFEYDTTYLSFYDKKDFEKIFAAAH